MMKRLFPTALAFAVLAFSGHLVAQTPNVSATKSDGTPAATKKNPGDTVTYTNTITNTGTGNATGVTFTDPDVNGAVVQMGTLKVSPLAFNDVYAGTVYANTRIDTNQSTEFSVTANDFAGMNAGVAATFTVTAFDAVSANGGAVVMVTSGADMGKFTYAPAPGFTGTDSFNYTITNNGSLSNTGTVSLTVSGPVVWYANVATGSDTTGNGTLYAPFASVNRVETVDAPGHRIFVASGTYNGTSFDMKDNQVLIGQGVVAASFDSFVLGGTPGADTVDARPSINGTKPNIARQSGGHTITLANNNTILGCTISSAGGGYALAGTSITSLQVGNSTAGVAAADTTVSSSISSLGCISLTGAATGTVNVTAQINASVGRSLNISDRTGGTLSCIGKVIDTGTGVSLASNSGATFNFRSLALANASGTSLSATGGGTLNITAGNSDGIDNDGDGSLDEADEANTINNTAGTALEVANTTIGASHLNFRSISAGAGSGNGITLNTTGSTGGLRVVGSGSTATGGTISGKTGSDGSATSGHGIYLNSTTDPQFAWMNIQGCQNHGIRGTSVAGFTLTNSTVGDVTANGTSITADTDAVSYQGEGSIRFFNLSGAGTFTNCTIDQGFSKSVAIVNNTGTASVTFSGCTLRNVLTASTASDALYFQATGSSTIANLTVTGACQFTSFRQNAIQTNAQAGARMTLLVENSTFRNTHTSYVGSSNTLVFNGTGTNTFVTFTVNNNTLTHGTGLADPFVATGINPGRIMTAGMVNGAGTFHGKITNNTFGTTGIARSGGGNGADSIGFFANGANGSNGGSRLLVQNNIIQRYGQAGMQIGAVGVGANVNASIDATILGNTVREPGTAAQGAFAAIWAYAGNATGDTNVVNLAIGGANAPDKNTMTDSDPSNLTDVFLGNIGVATAPINIHRNGTGSGALTPATDAQINALIVSNNNAGLNLSNGHIQPVNIVNGLPTAPPLMFAAGGVEKTLAAADHLAAAALPVVTESSQIRPNPTSSSLEEITPVTSRARSAEIARLAQTDLDSMVSSALALWKASGLTPEQEEHLRSLTFEVSNLDGIRLGEADGHIIRIDADAGGSGWYVDASDRHFAAVNASPTRLLTNSEAPAAGRLDLLTAILHEMGHTLGLEDSYLAQDRDSLMYGFLTLGERRLPAKGQAFGARVHDHNHGEKHFLTGAINIGTLPPGKSVTITYDVIINNPATTTTLSSQATVSGSNFTDVLTDDLVTGGDPLLPGAADPTVTLINLPDVNVAVANSPVAEDSGTAMTYTFTREAPTTSAMTVNFALSGTATPATDYAVAANTGTLTYTSGNTTGTITIPAGSLTASFNVTPVTDTGVEGNETVIVSVATGTGYDVGIDGPATGTITNDDTEVSIDALPDSSLFEDQVTNFSYTFRRTGVITGAITANFTVGGTAVFATDYGQSGATTFTATTGTVVFNAGETTKTVTIDPTADNAVEGSETIILTVTSGSGYTVGSPTAQTGTIVDDDVEVNFVSLIPSAVNEDGGVGMVYSFNRSGGSIANSLTVNVVVTGTAGLTGDYSQSGFNTFDTTTGAATIVFAAGNANKTVTITPSADATGEPDETVTLTLAANGTPAVTGGYTVGAGTAGTGTITNDDTTVSVAVAPGSVLEDSGTPMVYTFTRTGSTTAAQVVNFSVGGTATNTTDYAASSTDTFTYTPPTGTITIPIGQATATLSVTPATDAIVEANETVILTVTAGAGYVPAAGPNNVATGTITDDDVATVSIAKIQDGNEGPPTVNGKFRITQTAVSSTNTVVNYNVTGSATPGPGNDYATLSGTATILAGNTTVDIDVIVQTDVGSEGPESVIVTFSTFGAHDADITFGSPTTATVTIYSGSIITGTWNGDPLISTSGSFDCSGLTLDIDLGFVPSIGVPYTLIHADGGVTGNFNDLPPNGVIALSINGDIYYFQATYTGTDVILTAFNPSGPAEWKWVSGPSSRNGVGVYGTLGTAAPTNNPGARQGAMNWYSPDGSLWMFGGYGYATALTSPPRYLNDVWQYKRDTGEWVWRAGANAFNTPGTYGSLGVEAAGNTPGARHTGTTWTDADGNLWLFGGFGIGASGAPSWLNDLWRFNRTTGQWTHMKGSTATGGAATYGVLDTPAPGNTPGARSSATGVFRNGNLWLFGGYNGSNYYNDLWRFEIATGNWAWVEGSAVPNQNGVYGVQGTPNAANVPGSRRDATGWAADNGTLWFFGGLGLPASGPTAGDMNDLWRYDVTTGDWTWIKGASTVNGAATYGVQNSFAPGNMPGARSAGSGWVTVDGDLWLVGGFKDSNLTFDDVWVFDVGTQQWTWRLGSQGLLSQPGVYGTQGTAAPGNKPGGRFTPSTWVTLNGNLWIFGGGGADSFGNTGRLSDLWTYGIPKPANAPYEDAFPDAFPNNLIVNAAPSAGDATAGTMAYVPVSGKLTGTDADGDRILFNTAGSSGISQGTLTLNPDGTWTYTPAYGFTGVASFQFKAADNYGGESAVKTLVISVISNPADSDGDGIADSYEQSTWGSLAAADGDGDADLDGQSNYFEFLAGTNPLDGNETLVTAPTVSGTTSANGHVLLNLNHVRPGVNYHLETSSDLDAWSRIGTFTFDVSGSATVEDPTPATGAPRFYRMSLEATPALVVP